MSFKSFLIYILIITTSHTTLHSPFYSLKLCSMKYSKKPASAADSVKLTISDSPLRRVCAIHLTQLSNSVLLYSPIPFACAFVVSETIRMTSSGTTSALRETKSHETCALHSRLVWEAYRSYSIGDHCFPLHSHY